MLKKCWSSGEYPFQSLHDHRFQSLWISWLVLNFHIMQAVRDGVIEASIDHERGFMRSKVHVNTVGPSPCVVVIIGICANIAYSINDWISTKFWTYRVTASHQTITNVCTMLHSALVITVHSSKNLWTWISNFMFDQNWFLIPKVDRPYIYWIRLPKDDHLAENVPYLHHHHYSSNANTSICDVNPNTTSLITVKFIRLV